MKNPEFAPILILGALLAVVCALVFGLLGQRRIDNLFALVPASALGVLLAQLASVYIGSSGVLVGDLHAPEAAAAAWALLLIAKRLGL